MKREQLGIKSLSFKGKMVGSVPTKSIYFSIFFMKKGDQTKKIPEHTILKIGKNRKQRKRQKP